MVNQQKVFHNFQVLFVLIAFVKDTRTFQTEKCIFSHILVKSYIIIILIFTNFHLFRYHGIGMVRVMTDN